MGAAILFPLAGAAVVGIFAIGFGLGYTVGAERMANVFIVGAEEFRGAAEASLRGLVDRLREGKNGQEHN